MVVAFVVMCMVDVGIGVLVDICVVDEAVVGVRISVLVGSNVDDVVVTSGAVVMSI